MTEYNNIQTLSLGVCHQALRDFIIITEIISSWTQLKHIVAFGLFFLCLNTFLCHPLLRHPLAYYVPLELKLLPNSCKFIPNLRNEKSVYSSSRF